MVSVADTGVGIAPEDQAKVFEQFGQAGDTLTDKPRGTGLGLPICREIVEHHGGRLWLESAVGAGSTFRFTLPAPTGEPPGLDTDGCAVQRPSVPGSDVQHVRITAIGPKMIASTVHSGTDRCFLRASLWAWIAHTIHTTSAQDDEAGPGQHRDVHTLPPLSRSWTGPGASQVPV